ncbi:MAG: phosphatase PAP2 family protein [Bacteroidota bacterium]
MKSILWMIFCLTFGLATAQSPYQLDKKKEIIIYGAASTLLGTSIALEYTAVSPFSESQISNLDRTNINAFDRRATNYLSSSAAEASDYLKYVSYPLPLFFAFHKNSRKDVKKILILYGETLFLTSGTTGIAKRLVRRTRPLIYNENVLLERKLNKDAKYSFFSGHTSVTTANFIFAAKVFSDYFPESKWKPIVWSGAILGSVSTGYFRVRGGRHFPTDVIAGFLVGGAFGYFVPHFHKVKSSKNLSINSFGTGVHVSYRF